MTGVEAYHSDVLAERLAQKPLTLPQAIATARDKLALPHYDIHCNVFTRDGFVTLMTDLEEAGAQPFHTQEIEDVVRGTIEFEVLLTAKLGVKLSPDLQPWLQTVSAAV